MSWQKRAADLKPTNTHDDLIGASLIEAEPIGAELIETIEEGG